MIRMGIEQANVYMRVYEISGVLCNTMEFKQVPLAEKCNIKTYSAYIIKTWVATDLPRADVLPPMEWCFIKLQKRVPLGPYMFWLYVQGSHMTYIVSLVASSTLKMLSTVMMKMLPQSVVQSQSMIFVPKARRILCLLRPRNQSLTSGYHEDIPRALTGNNGHSTLYK